MKYENILLKLPFCECYKNVDGCPCLRLGLFLKGSTCMQPPIFFFYYSLPRPRVFYYIISTVLQCDLLPSDHTVGRPQTEVAYRRKTEMPQNDTAYCTVYLCIRLGLSAGSVRAKNSSLSCWNNKSLLERIMLYCV